MDIWPAFGLREVPAEFVDRLGLEVAYRLGLGYSASTVGELIRKPAVQVGVFDADNSLWEYHTPDLGGRK